MSDHEQPRGRRVLMVAFHYPPFRGSSGLQRTLAFSRYLPRYGWQPIVLTVRPSAYPAIGADQLADIPTGVPVSRSLALDTSRHLAVRGHYPAWLSLPDRWVSWCLTAIPAGLRLIRRHAPDVLWSTYPIATAHLIGYALHRLTGVPWVADFRDPMTEVEPLTGRRFGDPTVWRVRRWVERLATKHSAVSVFVTPSALSLYRDRYPDVAEERWALIPNGYDEATIAAVERIRERRDGGHPPGRRGPLTLVHSGTLYPTPDRDPSDFFRALAGLRESGRIRPGELQVVLRATGYDDHHRRLIERTGVGDVVALAPAVGYREALGEMLDADGLLVFQGRDSNPAIPAKVYEYLRVRRPIFAMVDPGGDTAALLEQLGVGTRAPLLGSERIAESLLAFLDDVHRGASRVLDLAEVRRFSREAASGELAAIFETVSAGAAGRAPRTEQVRA